MALSKGNVSQKWVLYLDGLWLVRFDLWHCGLLEKTVGRFQFIIIHVTNTKWHKEIYYCIVFQQAELSRTTLSNSTDSSRQSVPVACQPVLHARVCSIPIIPAKQVVSVL